MSPSGLRWALSVMSWARPVLGWAPLRSGMGSLGLGLAIFGREWGPSGLSLAFQPGKGPSQAWDGLSFRDTPAASVRVLFAIGVKILQCII